MRDGLRQAEHKRQAWQAWSGGLARIGGWAPGHDAEPVLEALGLAIVLDLLGELEGAPASERSLLRELGRRALLAGPPSDDPPDPEDWQRARSVAQAGLALLEGRAPDSVSHMHPTAVALAQMLRGAPDGLTAGARASHARSCEACLAEVRVLRMAEGDGVAPLVALAAADGVAMRAPMEGRPVGRLSDPEVEAYLFEEGSVRRLAIYATASEPVRLVAEGVTTDQMLSGYWLGQVTTSERVIYGRLHVGQHTVAWKIELTAG